MFPTTHTMPVESRRVDPNLGKGMAADQGSGQPSPGSLDRGMFPLRARDTVADMTKTTDATTDIKETEPAASGDAADLARQLRVDIIRASDTAGSGHPSSSLSAADLMAVLYKSHLAYDFDDPANDENDRVVFSKGHASPLVYGLLRAAGAISDEELLTYREHGSRLEGHPTPRLPWVEVATGSLGQGLPIGVGMALTARHLDRLPYRTWVLCGDSEMAEGSMWEAIEHASHAGLGNLTAIIDVNRLGQRGPTRHGWDLDAYTARLEAFGWQALPIDGHDLDAIDEAYRTAEGTTNRPTAIVARTVKGRGAPAIENRDGHHGKPLEDADDAVAALGGVTHHRLEVAKPSGRGIAHRFTASSHVQPPRWELGDKVATRAAYGEALTALAHERGDVVALDGEVSNSTKADTFAKAHPERFFECYIAEQQMVAAGVGMQARGWRPFLSSFAAFLTRAADFVRMAPVSHADLCLTGSHAGVSIGPDGPSQMGLEDLALFRSVLGSTVVCPSDANQAARLLPLLADRPGVCYMRTNRPGTEVLTPPDEPVRVGGSRVLRQSADDAATVVAAGVTVHEAVAAADELAEQGVAIRVIDCYSIKPIDAATLQHAAGATHTMVTVEDHAAEGGLGDAVREAVGDSDDPPRVTSLAVRHLPASATGAEQLDAAGIDAAHIAATVRDLLGATPVGGSARS